MRERERERVRNNEGERLRELKCEGYYWVNVNDLMHYSHWDYDKQILIITINLRGHYTFIFYTSECLSIKGKQNVTVTSLCVAVEKI